VDKYFSRYAPAGCSSAAFKDGGGQKGVQNNEFQGFGLDFDDEEEEDGDYAPPEFWKKSIRVGPEFQVWF
jgi:hypothetical protein